MLLIVVQRSTMQAMSIEVKVKTKRHTHRIIITIDGNEKRLETH
jgi:hypothetical protein